MLYPRTNGKIIPLSQAENDKIKIQMTELLHKVQQLNPKSKADLLKKLQLKAKEIVNEQRR